MSASEGVFAGGRWVDSPRGAVYLMPGQSLGDVLAKTPPPARSEAKPQRQRRWYQIPGWLLGQALLSLIGVIAICVGRPLKKAGLFLWRFRLVRLLARPFVAVAVLAWKAKVIFVFLFKLKGVATVTTLGVSLLAYSWFWSWPFAVGFVALLFVHECGHWLVLKRQGIKTSPILFIPFFGAVIAAKELPKGVLAEAKMAIGGPILGSVGALACLGLSHAFHSPFLQGLAYVGFLLNLFNLIPVVPLDGGRIIAALSPWLWLAGVAGFVGLAVWWRAWSMLAFLGLILPVLSSRWAQRHDESYYALPRAKRLAVGGAYVGLALALIVGMRVSAFHQRTVTRTTVVQHFYIGPEANMITPACYTWWSPAKQRYVAGYPMPKGGEAPKKIQWVVTKTAFLIYDVGHGRRQRVDWRPCGTDPK